MTTRLESQAVVDRLRELGDRDSDCAVFGAKAHRFELNPTLDLSKVEEFETQYGVGLPADYRLFITEIGNGGAGPYYGLFPFGYHDAMRGLCKWNEDWPLVGDLSAEFPHDSAWNLPDEFWKQMPDPPLGTPPEVEDKMLEDWNQQLEQRYWNPEIMKGAIPIAHLGCALRQWLVINGPQSGFVWEDRRADYGGIFPLQSDSGQQVSFSDWYLTWLHEAAES